MLQTCFSSALAPQRPSVAADTAPPSQYSFRAFRHDICHARSSTGNFVAVICFLRAQGSSNFLTIRHRPEVRTLSGRTMSQSVSAPLQDGIRFFRHSSARTPDSVPCGLTCPNIRAEILVYHVPQQLHRDNTDLFRTPAEQHSHMVTLQNHILSAHLLVRASQPFGLLS